LAGFGISRGEVGVGEKVGRIEKIECGMAVAAGLRATPVEAAAAGAGDIGPNAVEDSAAFFVGIEPVAYRVKWSSVSVTEVNWLAASLPET